MPLMAKIQITLELGGTRRFSIRAVSGNHIRQNLCGPQSPDYEVFSDSMNFMDRGDFFNKVVQEILDAYNKDLSDVGLPQP